MGSDSRGVEERVDEDVRVVDNPAARRFEVVVGGEVAGYAEYHERPGTLSLTHTVVLDRFEGRGLGSALVRGALAEARARGVAVLPFYPFVRSYLERHPEYLDLVPPGRRAEFGLSAPRGA